MKNAAFIRAAVPEPFRILGKKLTPYTVGHEILFQKWDVAYSVEHPSEPNFSDLILGVFICSRTFSECVRDLQSPFASARLWAWGKWCGRFDIDEKSALFSKYIQFEIPKLIPKPGNGRLKTPWILGILTALQFECGMKSEEALNEPLALALWKIIGHRDAQGMIDIWDESTDANIEEGKKLLDEIMSGKIDFSKGRPCYN